MSGAEYTAWVAFYTVEAKEQAEQMAKAKSNRGR